MAHEYRTRRRMEFADTDMAGTTHFSRFHLFMEQAETELLRSLGLTVQGGTDDEGNVIGWPRLAAAGRIAHVLGAHVLRGRGGDSSHRPAPAAQNHHLRVPVLQWSIGDRARRVDRGVPPLQSR